MNISKCLIENHKEVDIDYTKKYSLDNIQEKVIVDYDEIRNKLKEFRLNKSKEDNLKAYMVFNNETMEEIISTMPMNIDELRGIKGFGDIKIQKYGEEILNIIRYLYKKKM